MAYTKLQLENFKSAWTVEEVDHIEQGILANESALTQKQDVLVSGQNIKTINGLSLVGSGDVDFSTLGYLTADSVPNANWVTNTINNARYIFNRPFYSEYTDSAIQNEITYTTNKTMSNSFNVSTLIEAGKDYKIVFDGIEYYCTAKSSETEGWIGNGSLINADYSNTGEPFAVKYLAPTPTTSSITVYSTAGTHSFYLGEITNETIHHLPDKYLSKNILRDNTMIIDFNQYEFQEYGPVDGFPGEVQISYDQNLISLFQQISTQSNVLADWENGYHTYQAQVIHTMDGDMIYYFDILEGMPEMVVFMNFMGQAILYARIAMTTGGSDNVIPEETINNLYDALI